MPNKRHHDIAGIGFAIGFVALGVAALYGSREMSPLGSVFPRTVAGALIVFAFAYIVEALLRGVEQPARSQSESTLRRALLVGCMLGWALLLTVLGFVVSSVIGFALLSAVASYQRWTWKRTLLYLFANAVVVLGFFALFHYALLVPLPKGLLF